METKNFRFVSCCNVNENLQSDKEIYRELNPFNKMKDNPLLYTTL